MIIPNVNYEYSGKEMIFGKNMILTLSEKYHDDFRLALFCELYKNFTASVGKLEVKYTSCDCGCAVLSNKTEELKPIELNGNEYGIEIDSEKAVLCFDDGRSFAHAFSTLLQMIEVVDTSEGNEKFTLPVTLVLDKPRLKVRMAHLCIMAENSFAAQRKRIREVGLFKYSHLIIEFWGMYKFNCCNALADNEAFNSEQVKLLVHEAKALGVEVIPMLNIWGHASLNRVDYGKHTALDNDPKMQPFFSQSGWEWNILNPKVEILHHQMIDELIDLCESSEYFHIGCDEAYTHGFDRNYYGKDRIDVIADYLNRTSEYLKSKGFRTLMWGDMLLYEPEWLKLPSHLSQHGEDAETVERLCKKLSRDIVLVDWQYFHKEKTVPSTKFLASKGFDTMLAAWDDIETIKIDVQNVIDNNYYGFMATTWNTTDRHMSTLPLGAEYSWNGTEEAVDINVKFNFYNVIKSFTAACLRKLLPCDGVYENSGISKTQYDKP